VFVECGRIQSWGDLQGPCAWGHETIENGRVFRGWGRQAELMQDTNETLETTVHGHYFADPGGCGSEIGEMGKRIEQG
jgi:hypothetical protein